MGSRVQILDPLPQHCCPCRSGGQSQNPLGAVAFIGQRHQSVGGGFGLTASGGTAKDQGIAAVVANLALDRIEGSRTEMTDRPTLPFCLSSLRTGSL